MQTLLDKKKADTLTAEETVELEAIGELDEIFSYLNCEYCHYPELLSSAPLSIDHIQPQSLGGDSDLDNLALACRRCNERRYNFITGKDPQTNTEVELFNPPLSPPQAGRS